MHNTKAAAVPDPSVGNPALGILLGASAVHLLNDLMQSVVPAVFPIFQQSMALTFAQIGWIAFTLNLTASVFQPLIGSYTDRKPLPSLLPLGMLFTFLGMLGLAFASSYVYLLLSAALVGIGSSVLHPESSRVSHLAAVRSKGFAQSVFQVGGNAGQAIAPLLVAFVLSPQGQYGFLWFIPLAAAGIAIQLWISRWYRVQIQAKSAHPTIHTSRPISHHSKRFIIYVMTILIIMLFSKFVYLASMSGYYSFYFMEKYGLPLKNAQICLFALQFAGMLGTFLGGPLADRMGRQKMIWFSILGTAPFSLLLPYASPTGAICLCLAIGLILMSGFSVIIVYAQEMLPGRVGTVSGLLFGVSFGLGGLGSVVIGNMIDSFGLSQVILASSLLPLLGILALLLPKDSVIVLKESQPPESAVSSRS